MTMITNAERQRRIDAARAGRILRSLPPQPLLRLPQFEGETERRIAYLMQVDPVTIRRWRAGRRLPIETARRVAAHLGLSIGEIWYTDQEVQ